MWSECAFSWGYIRFLQFCIFPLMSSSVYVQSSFQDWSSSLWGHRMNPCFHFQSWIYTNLLVNFALTHAIRLCQFGVSKDLITPTKKKQRCLICGKSQYHKIYVRMQYPPCNLFFCFTTFKHFSSVINSKLHYNKLGLTWIVVFYTTGLPPPFYNVFLATPHFP